MVEHRDRDDQSCPQSKDAYTALTSSRILIAKSFRPESLNCDKLGLKLVKLYLNILFIEGKQSAESSVARIPKIRKSGVWRLVKRSRGTVLMFSLLTIDEYQQRSFCPVFM